MKIILKKGKHGSQCKIHQASHTGVDGVVRLNVQKSLSVCSGVEVWETEMDVMEWATLVVIDPKKMITTMTSLTTITFLR